METLERIAQLIPFALQSADLPLAGKQSGKVREWYLLDETRRLVITTDRLSAFDRILACVPYKGQVLNQLSAWWFSQTADILPNHLQSLPDPNAAVVVSARPFPVEVIVRGFITGVTSTALWYRYSTGEREIYGYRFPEGLRKNEPLPEPIITPTTKGGAGEHDERLTCGEVVEKGYLDAATWEEVMTAALAVFKHGQEIARRNGLILVDTKYEFGRSPDGKVILIDEVHTPDSSRFWLAESYEERLRRGEEPENYDKEFIRLEYAGRGYRGEGGAPEMPAELWARAGQRYISVYEKLTGQSFVPGAYPARERLLNNLKKEGILP